MRQVHEREAARVAPAEASSYDICSDIPPHEYWSNDRDSAFYFEATVRNVFDATMNGARGLLLDVASGEGSQVRAFAHNKRVQPVGLEMSLPMIVHAHTVFERESVSAPLVRGSAHELPFRDGTFNRIVCQGSLDHFDVPRAFLAEAARVLAPDGRLVIALHNYDSASCRMSRALYRLRGILGVSRDDPTGASRPYWEIPENHTFRGNVATLREMTRRDFQPDRVFGVSMFWLLPMWRRVLRIVPSRAATAMLQAADRLAHRSPELGDMIVSVWRPRPRSGHFVLNRNGAATASRNGAPSDTANRVHNGHGPGSSGDGKQREEGHVVSRLTLEGDVE